MQNKQMILIVDDNAEVRLSARFFLIKHGFDVLEAESPAAGLEIVKTQSVDLVLLDMNFSRDTTSGEEGLYCLRQIRQLDDVLPVVAITAWSSTDLVVKALKEGAQDFIEKPWDNQRLLQVIGQSLKLESLQKENQKFRQQANDKELKLEVVAHSESMRELLSQLDGVAQTQASILLTGENGTGKSTLARYIHQKYVHHKNSHHKHSHHKDWESHQPPLSGTDDGVGELISVNMGAIPDNLFESEMFGHTKGAFTGAHQARIGRFELAQRGTLFLDEVGTIPLVAQAKLLRVLESGEYERVGSSVTQMANVRVISATNASFEKLFSQGQFRRDLYFRLNTIELRVPALRERRDDIPRLAEIMLLKLCQRYHKAPMSLLPCALQRLCEYDFPGNLRELSHILERVVLLHKAPGISAEALRISGPSTPAPASSPSSPVNDAPNTAIPLMTIEQAERQLIDQALRQCNGQTLEAAEVLGLSKSAIYRRLEKYRIIAKDYLSDQTDV